MRAKEAAVRAGVTVKALRHYESIGLLEPVRESNGYRDYSRGDVRLVVEIKKLTGLGLALKETKPFVECLRAGHVGGDECPESLAMYQRKIAQLDELIAHLSRARDELNHQMREAAERGFTVDRDDPAVPPLPADLPVPLDDGAADHLPGQPLPDLSLPSTNGERVRLTTVAPGRWVLFVYPLTGRPGVDLPTGWDQIPGARGCSQDACGFRDNLAALLSEGVQRVVGLSTNSTEYQSELVDRLGLPYSLLSDRDWALAATLGLPMFTAGGLTLYKRLTMVLHGDRIEHVFYPVFPPDTHPRQVLAWLRRHPVPTPGAGRP